MTETPEVTRPKVLVRLMKWDRYYSKAEHRDVDITEFTLWEPPGGGWFVCAIAVGDKGLPPWDGDTVGQVRRTPENQGL